MLGPGTGATIGTALGALGAGAATGGALGALAPARWSATRRISSSQQQDRIQYRQRDIQSQRRQIQQLQGEQATSDEELAAPGIQYLRR